MGDYLNGVNLEDIDDELELHAMMDQTDDIEERKLIRNRLKEILAYNRAKREEMLSRREQDREDAVKNKFKVAEEQKRRTLAMYDAMAKSSPAGGQKVIDVQILRTGVPSAEPPVAISGPNLDLVEQGLRKRVRESDERKQRTLAAFDKASKSSPAGTVRLVDFENVTSEDILQANAPKQTSTFGMSGGIPFSSPATARRVAPRKVEPEYDPVEISIRKRKQEADARKAFTLQAYDQAARSREAGGPVSVYIPYSPDIPPVICSLERPRSGSSPGTPSPASSPSQDWRQQRTTTKQAPTPPPKPQPIQVQSKAVPQYGQPQQQYQQPQQQFQQQQQQRPQSPITPPNYRQQQQQQHQQQMNIKTQSTVRNVSNPYENNRPVINQQLNNAQKTATTTRTVVTTQGSNKPYENDVLQNQQNSTTTRTTVTTQKTVQQPVQVSSRQVTVTSQSKTVQQQQQQQQQQRQVQQRYYEEEEESEEEESEEEE